MSEKPVPSPVSEEPATPPVSEKPAPSPSEALKERVAAIVGLLIVATFLIVSILAIIAAWARGTQDGLFSDIKDLLILLSGFVGTILGYYFGRLPAEKRAETAEASVQVAQTAWSQAERQAAQAVARLDVEGLAREAAEKTKELAEEARTKAEQVAEAAQEAKAEAEEKIDQMGEVMTDVTQGMHTMRARVETFKQQLSEAGEAAAGLGSLVLGAEEEGEAAVAVDTQPLEDITSDIDVLLAKVEQVQK